MDVRSRSNSYDGCEDECESDNRHARRLKRYSLTKRLQGKVYREGSDIPTADFAHHGPQQSIQV